MPPIGSYRRSSRGTYAPRDPEPVELPRRFAVVVDAPGTPRTFETCSTYARASAIARTLHAAGYTVRVEEER